MSEHDQPFAVVFDNVGHLIQVGREGWQEPVCGECGGRIRWCLDMFSFAMVKGRQTLCHATCVWTEDGFKRQAKVARKLDNKRLKD